VRAKEDSSPVTEADRQAERIIRRMIADRFPGEAILGEEEGGDDVPDRWVVDPIDGTKSFICGVPLYATLLSYEVDRQPQVAVCYFPALDEMLQAERGGGSWFNGRPCRVSEDRLIEGSVLAVGSHKSMAREHREAGFQALADRALATRTWGDAYGHMLVATGRVAAMVDPVVKHWDISAVSLIVREAGGRFTDFSGSDRLGCEAISSNALVHDELLRSFAG